ncbi:MULTISPECIES: flagellar basal body-associated protein FliL [Alteromonadaceae]|uniref:flagellar basal body-associated protein FliL n=1 Tax=Alteromonadaceae TaxID=72275 RepID=UPI001C084376|nr:MULTISPECIES: flagellar basal body-associated protein FliL [Aliiglaciecola]MBU2878025.1 flagellar basal body-associated protein FliL [Aliiglaciecola lipolytica]MDO6709390.1 flagellar basal body-associated protein FliL [Aliiglaciecola sp. 2_MG-2023]MDO6750538.1 flagellar basal body-associated protein FliL [Aliiglaciecola sp. 1_MG-2023]
MAEEELQMEEGGKGKMMIIIIIAVVLIGGGAAAYFLLGSSDEPDMAVNSEMTAESGDDGAAMSSANKGTALYVAMPRPFVFNVPGQGKDRLAQIKVQLMVRGTDNEELAKMHVPLIEGTLLKVFSSSNADDLVTEAGKVSLRDQAGREVQKVLKETVGNEVVEQVLFTGFVMQ